MNGKYSVMGYVEGFSTKSLNIANQRLSEARKSTPDSLRKYYRSRIVACTGGLEYIWDLIDGISIPSI